MNHSAAKASPGSVFIPPAASVWNDMVDAGEAWSRQRISQGGGQPIRARSTDMIKIRNTETDRSKGEILEISGKTLTTTTSENPWLDGVVPADGFFGILKEPILAGEIGSMQVSGVCLALVDITDTAHTHADAVAGDYVLSSGYVGSVEILYAPASTGEQECVVRFGTTRPRAIVLAGNLSAATDGLDDSSLPSATARFLESDGVTGWQADATTSLTVYNRAEGVSFASGLLGHPEMILGKLCFIPYDCGPVV